MATSRDSMADLAGTRHHRPRSRSSAEECLRSMFAELGIQVDGHNAWDIHVHQPAFYERILAEGSLGLGESYMEGWWDCEDIVDFVGRLAVGDAEQLVRKTLKGSWAALRARVFNLQSKERALLIGEKHYDRRLDIYEMMSGEPVVLSCGYWKDAKTLANAQTAKFDLICNKLAIGENDRILDIGCGYGSFLKYAVQNHGCTAVGVNISPDQAERAREACAGLPVDVRSCDYRDTRKYVTKGKFDKVVSIGMFEHVGYKNYREFFQVVHDALTDEGIALLQTIGAAESRTRNDPWFDKYIFPNALIPSVRHIGGAIERLFVMEDWHNFGYDYHRTLAAWYDNFDKRYEGSRSDVLYRMWRYYLLSASALFRARKLQLWQVVLSKGGVAEGYVSQR